MPWGTDHDERPRRTPPRQRTHRAGGGPLATPDGETMAPDMKTVKKMRGHLLTTSEVREIPPPEPLVHDWLNRDSLAMLYGPSGGGKTFVGIDWALSVATGTPWNGTLVERGPVVYVLAEGVSGAGARVDAWMEHHAVDLDDCDPVWWYPQAVNLAVQEAARDFAGMVRRLDPVPALVVFDTLARCTLGAEENSAKEMGVVVAHLDLIRRATGACVLIVHHTGKDSSAGARGSSAFKGALDTEVELVGDSDCCKVRCTKQKDGPEPSSPVHLVRVPVGESCAMVPSEQAATSDGDLLPVAVRATLEALASVQVNGGVPAGVWLKATDCQERTFYRHRARLLARGDVVNMGSDAQPRYLIPGEGGKG